MLNKLRSFIKQYDMIAPGDTVICAVSGGADSMALLFALYLLAPQLSISLKAAHFNHHLRGEESDRDEVFVKTFCEGYQIPLYLDSAVVKTGAKGLEAAAREARYTFLRSLPGKIATAHTADDNAETVLMHLVRGTGLKGLGGIMPVNDNVVRPLLSVTRAEILTFLEQYHISYITDSSNDTDQFLRNRLRHHVIPLLQQENPSLSLNLSAMALRLRQDEEVLSGIAVSKDIHSVSALREMQPAVRCRALAMLLESGGVKEPEAAHIALAQNIVLSDKPSARADFSGGITLQRSYDTLFFCVQTDLPMPVDLPCPGSVSFGGFRITAEYAKEHIFQPDRFTVIPDGKIVIRTRQAGDAMRLSGGTKSLKKLFIDKKIPEHLRNQIPVVADTSGVLGVQGFGPNLNRVTEGAEGILLCFEKE